MPNNVSVVEETPTSALLSADLPSTDGGMPVTTWIVDYEPVRKDLQEKEGETFSNFNLGKQLIIRKLN